MRGISANFHAAITLSWCPIRVHVSLVIAHTDRLAAVLQLAATVAVAIDVAVDALGTCVGKTQMWLCGYMVKHTFLGA